MEQVTLGLADALIEQPSLLSGGFHPLGRHGEAQVVEHGEHGAQEGARRFARLIKPQHEGAIHLHRMDRQGNQSGQRGIAGAEIIDGDGHRSGHELFEEVIEGGAAVLEGILQQLHLQGPADRQRVVFDQLQQAGTQIGLLQQDPGEVDAHRHRPLRDGQGQQGHGGKRLLDDQQIELAGDATLVERRQEGGRTEQLIAPLPARQGLEADWLAAAEIHDRLEVGLEQAVLEGFAQIGLKSIGFACQHPCVGVDETEGADGGTERQPYGHARVGQDRLHRVVVAAEQGDADGHPHRQGLRATAVGLVGEADDPLRGPLHIGIFLVEWQQHHQLGFGEAGHGAAARHRRQHPPCTFVDELLGDRSAQGGVDAVVVAEAAAQQREGGAHLHRHDQLNRLQQLLAAEQLIEGGEALPQA